MKQGSLREGTLYSWTPDRLVMDAEHEAVALPATYEDARMKKFLVLYRSTGAAMAGARR